MTVVACLRAQNQQQDGAWNHPGALARRDGSAHSKQQRSAGMELKLKLKVSKATVNKLKLKFHVTKATVNKLKLTLNVFEATVNKLKMTLHVFAETVNELKLTLNTIKAKLHASKEKLEGLVKQLRCRLHNGLRQKTATSQSQRTMTAGGKQRKKMKHDGKH
jgi:chromosome segregation ATPase